MVFMVASVFVAKVEFFNPTAIKYKKFNVANPMSWSYRPWWAKLQLIRYSVA
jgi:hypothetical protein